MKRIIFINKSYSQSIIIYMHEIYRFIISYTKPFFLWFSVIMAMSVIRTKRGLVKPAEETPLTTVLDLSAIDRLPVLRCNARTLHVFKHGPEATRVIREALSKALVPYYPLAGRLKESKPVEASSDCTLRSVNFFDDVHSIPYDHLLPDAIPESQCIHPLVQIQVSCYKFHEHK